VAVAAAMVLLVLAAASPAGARNLNGVPSNLTEQVTTPNFVVHFTTQPGDPNAITIAAAQQLANNAERALGDEESRLQFPSPVTDGDGRADV
jgi:predicted pyridoxine 5'-phosphate oxidase superfamily flavin-nucleotide-binding protein